MPPSAQYRVTWRNFSFMASRYPRAGGIYDYTKEVFGYDRAFLVFWFLSLTYISIFWANATSLPLFARFFTKYGVCSRYRTTT